MEHIGWKIAFVIWTIPTGLISYMCLGYLVNNYLQGSNPFADIGLVIFLMLAMPMMLFIAIEAIIGYFAFRGEKADDVTK